MLMREKKKEGAVRGCLVPIAAVLGIMLVCFVLCFVVFQLDQNSVGGSTSSFLFFFGG